MTREEILWHMGWPSVAAAAVSDLMDRIEATVRAAEKAEREKEREACAKVCADKVDAEYATGKVDHNEMAWTQACAIAIRARRESK